MQKKVTILVAEDDDDDFLLIEEAFQDAQILNPYMRVKDGAELLDFLERKEPYQEYKNSPLPSIILLDLNMPKIDGRLALETIRKNPKFKSIPVIILTTSKAQEDIIASYEIGANSYIRKPINFPDLIEVMQTFKKFWIEIVELPINK